MNTAGLPARALYALLREQAHSSARVARVIFGLSWSAVELDDGRCGLCYSPAGSPRDIPWAGSLAGRRAMDMLAWLDSEQPCEVVAAVATLNAILDYAHFPPAGDGRALHCTQAPHLAVFEHFAPQLAGADVAVIGRYPGMQRFDGRFEFRCIERRPGPGDLPEEAAITVLPGADWVFITASSIANGTATTLLQLARQATVVLMGPSLCWSAQWAAFGVDYLAGVEILDTPALFNIIGEAGGTRIFRDAVHYRLAALQG